MSYMQQNPLAGCEWLGGAELASRGKLAIHRIFHTGRGRSRWPEPRLGAGSEPSFGARQPGQCVVVVRGAGVVVRAGGRVVEGALVRAGAGWGGTPDCLL